MTGDKPKNGVLKKVSMIAPIVVASVVVFYFWGNIFPPTALKLEAFQKEFSDYKESHDKWAETQIESFRGDIADLKIEVIALRQEIRELKMEIRQREAK